MHFIEQNYAKHKRNYAAVVKSVRHNSGRGLRIIGGKRKLDGDRMKGEGRGNKR